MVVRKVRVDEKLRISALRLMLISWRQILIRDGRLAALPRESSSQKR
jgi:hypothetical protein